MKLKITSAYLLDVESFRLIVEFAHECKLKEKEKTIIHKAKYN